MMVSARFRLQRRARLTVKRVVVASVLYQQFGTLVVTTRYTNIQLDARMVELCQSPIDQPQLALSVVDEDVKRFDVAVNDSFRVTVVEGDEKLVDVVALREAKARERSAQHSAKEAESTRMK